MPENQQQIIQVCLPVPFADTLSYLIPHDCSLVDIIIGARVVVPFRNQKRVAIVVSKNAGAYTKNLKEIISILDKGGFFLKT